MPVRFASKTRFRGTLTLSALNTETNVVNVLPQTDEYLVEGWIDLSALQDGDEVIVREYVSFDGGTTWQKFHEQEYRGVQDFGALRFHTKGLDRSFAYRVTITQTAGTLRSFEYGFMVLVFETV